MLGVNVGEVVGVNVEDIVGARDGIIVGKTVVGISVGDLLG